MFSCYFVGCFLAAAGCWQPGLLQEKDKVQILQRHQPQEADLFVVCVFFLFHVFFFFWGGGLVHVFVLFVCGLFLFGSLLLERFIRRVYFWLFYLCFFRLHIGSPSGPAAAHPKAASETQAPPKQLPRSRNDLPGGQVVMWFKRNVQ